VEKEFNPNPRFSIITLKPQIQNHSYFLLAKLLTIHAWFTSSKLGRIVSKEKRWDELHERWKREIKP
jgi:hypothetical protein